MSEKKNFQESDNHEAELMAPPKGARTKTWVMFEFPAVNDKEITQLPEGEG